VKIAPKPQPYAPENFGSGEQRFFLCDWHDTKGGEFEFFNFLTVKSCSDLKSKQGGFFRLGFAVRTKKTGKKIPIQ